MLPASYNLAAIYAQLNQRDKALVMLKRHFFEYERYQAVQSKEMMEARVDAVFASLIKDPEFISLTGKADGRLPLPQDRGTRQGPGASQYRTSTFFGTVLGVIKPRSKRHCACVVRLLRLGKLRDIKPEEVGELPNRTCQQRPNPKAHSYGNSASFYVYAAKEWLRFHGHLKLPSAPRPNRKGTTR